MLTSANRLIRAASVGAALMLGSTALVLSWDWLNVVVPARLYPRYLMIGLLAAFLKSYFVVIAAVLFGLLFLGNLFRYGGSRVVARWFLLCGSILLGVFFAEGAAAVYLFEVHRIPALPRRFAGPERPDGEILIVVAGESSALGVPYDGWLSVGTIVCRELQKVIPTHRFRVEVLAEKGATLEVMHRKLARLTERPDVLVVYSGHNEFLGRFSFSNRVAYYVDDRSSWRGQASIDLIGRFSPLYTLIRENLEKHRLSATPGQSLGVTDIMIGRPICTPDDTHAVLVDFQRRLEAIVTDCEHIGCLPVLIIPPGNDSETPNQSYAQPSTDFAARGALAQRLLDIDTIEVRDSDEAIVRYRQIVSEQPTHAGAQYRLARLLNSAGSFAEANRHFILARDCDGLPLRAISPLEAIYHNVGLRHPRSLVIDGPAVLRNKSRHGILGAELFHDIVHPTLAGHVALAEAVLSGLKSRAAFDWPASTSAPMLDPERCGMESGIDSAAWAAICERSAVFYGQIAFLTSAPSERIRWRDRFAAAAQQIRAGTPPEDVGIPGIGVSIASEPDAR